MIDYFPKELDAQQNFGDYLAELLKNLFIEDLDAADDVYYLVGSYICDYYVERARKLKKPDAKIHFWGCGWRGEPFKYLGDPDIDIAGIRGPLSREMLNLPADTALGDPGLLMPLLIPKPEYRSGKVLLVPHFYEPELPEIMNNRAVIGFDDLMLPHIYRGVPQLEMLIREIATADFVMAGAMHAAIIAQAYDVPFCFFKKEHLDVPFKWEDLAFSFGIRPYHFYTVEEGRAWYEAAAPHIKRPDMVKLLQAAPTTVKPEYLAAAARLNKKEKA